MNICVNCGDLGVPLDEAHIRFIQRTPDRYTDEVRPTNRDPKMTCFADQDDLLVLALYFF